MKERVAEHDAVIDKYKELVNALQIKIKNRDKISENWRFKAVVRGNQMKAHDKILLRTRHLEVHVEHRSLYHPPVLDVTLPDLTFEEWCY
jgi:hypothetical protein